MEAKQHQPAISINEQIENLKELGLIIENEEKAKAFLNDVSYFRLIKAYSLGLKPKNGSYQANITFDLLRELYLFNAAFRQLLFAQIERVEVNLRCRISNHVSMIYGVMGYKQAGNFSNQAYHEAFLAEVKSEIERNKRLPFVTNFLNNYEGESLPFYAIVELLSFGTLSKFYKNLKNPDKKAIAQTYGVGYTYLESWMEHIAFVRNICAHYGRIYNVNLTKTPILYKQYTEQGISNIRIFATLICLKHLLANDRHWREFVETIELLFEKYTHVRIELMGFGADWKDILLERPESADKNKQLDQLDGMRGKEYE